MDNLYLVPIGILLAGAPLLFFEVLSRLYKISAEITRKSVHVLTAIAVACMTFFLSLSQIAVISVLFLAFFIATRRYYIWKSLFRIKRRSYGEITFALGALLASLVAQDDRIFACSILILGFSDTAAAIIGQHYGQTHKLFNSKTIEGSLGFFLVTIFILGAFGIANLQTALAISAVITILELASSGGLDNIAVPLAASLILSFV